MKCVNCGKELKKHWNICPFCKTEIIKKRFCSNCGEELEDGWESCPVCGTRIVKENDVSFTSFATSYDNNYEKERELDNKKIEKEKKEKEKSFRLEMKKMEEEEKLDLEVAKKEAQESAISNEAYVKNYYNKRLYEQAFVRYWECLTKGGGFFNGDDTVNDWLISRVSYMYLHGLGTEKNEKEALRIMNLGRAYGSKQKTEELAKYYFNKRTYENINEAIPLYQEMLRNGPNAKLEYELGILYNDCKPRKIKEATKYLNLAAEHGHSEASKMLEQMYSLNSSDITDEDRKEYYLMAAKRGNTDAYYHLGLYCENDKDYKKAYEYYSAAPYNTGAQCRLGYFYLMGIYVKKDYKKADDLLVSSSIISKNADANYYLGIMREEGLGCKKSIINAAGFYEEAAKAHHVEASYKFGLMCVKGKGVEKDIEKGKRFLNYAKNYGHEGAKKALSKI